MATLQTDEANIIDSESINWRWIVYPVVLVLVIGAVVLGSYYYKLNAQETAETDARAALAKATTPAEFLKVAEQFPGTDQAMLAVLSAADASYNQHDYDGAVNAYNKIINDTTIGAVWRDAAQLGLGSCFEAKGDPDKAIAAYLEVAHRGEDSPYAPYAYYNVWHIYDVRGDKNNEAAILNQAVQIATTSQFTQMAISQLKALTPQAPAMTVPMPAGNAPAPAPLAPAPAH
jgi:tetratricopeptide (TPR) repeat protein